MFSSSSQLFVLFKLGFWPQVNMNNFVSISLRIGACRRNITKLIKLTLYIYFLMSVCKSSLAFLHNSRSYENNNFLIYTCAFLGGKQSADERNRAQNRHSFIN